MDHRITAAAAAVAFAVIAVAAPASATTTTRTLPEGQSLYTLTCDGDQHSLYTVNTETGAVVAVGDELTLDHAPCWTQGYWNPTDGQVYSVDWNNRNPDNNHYYISSIDPATGVVTRGADLHTEGDGSFDVYGLAISPAGVVYSSDGHGLYTVDVATGLATEVGSLAVDGSDFPVAPYSFSFNPVSGELVLQAYYQGIWYSVDLDTAAMTALTTEAKPASAGIAFDANGIAWWEIDDVSSFDVDWDYGFASGEFPDLDTSAGNVNAFWTDDSTYIYSESPVIVGQVASASAAPTAAALASTGFDGVSLLGTLGALALVAGAGFVAYRRVS